MPAQAFPRGWVWPWDNRTCRAPAQSENSIISIAATFTLAKVLRTSCESSIKRRHLRRLKINLPRYPISCRRRVASIDLKSFLKKRKFHIIHYIIFNIKIAFEKNIFARCGKSEKPFANKRLWNYKISTNILKLSFFKISYKL